MLANHHVNIRKLLQQSDQTIFGEVIEYFI